MLSHYVIKQLHHTGVTSYNKGALSIEHKIGQF